MLYKTALVTGAGSSIDISPSFLSGETLLMEIYKLVCKNHEFIKQLKRDKFLSEQIESFQTELYNFINFSSKKSIDEFLYEIMNFPEHIRHRETSIEIGKYAIFYCIMKMENGFVMHTEKLDSKLKWMERLKKYYIDHPECIIVTFNYDRLFEKYIDDTQARIHHVYGYIGLNNWEFGRIPESINDVRKHLGDFLIANDRVREKKEDVELGIERISKLLYCEDVFIMGFGFDYFNFWNLGFTEYTTRKIHINIFNIIDEDKLDRFSERRVLSDKIRRLLPESFHYYNTCSEFIHELFKLKP